MNPLRQLSEAGQSIWLDYIRRGMTRSGELARLVTDDGLRGMTSNPAIFQQAIAGSDDYADVIDDLVGDPDLEARTIFERLAVQDIREAADVLRPVFVATEGRDGYVSLEVAPTLAHDAEGTIDEARRLWRAVDRPNLMIKVPGTPAGIHAIETLLAEGINVNVTLIFALRAYQDVVGAWLRALERRVGNDLELAPVASVASFFVSRIDAEVDKVLRARGLDAGLGRTAIANAKVAYAWWQEVMDSDRWRALANLGARPQRLLWASTGTKDKAFSDVLYVDGLIGAETVNTVPPATMDAFRDHGRVTASLTHDVAGARTHLSWLKEVGVDLDAVTQGLLERGVVLFEEAMDGLLGTIATKQRERQGSRENLQSVLSWGELGDAVAERLEQWDAADGTARLWRRDGALFTNTGEDKWLGWLDIVATQKESIASLTDLAEVVGAGKWSHVLLLGMGGSSLCPDVLAHTYAAQAPKGAPKLVVLDSTDPRQVRAARNAVDLARTLVVVASKSGSTLEPQVLMDYFMEEMRAAVGPEPGQHFVAITDPGSKLEHQAHANDFLHVFHGVPDIGGRFSALSNFGLVPAALMGLPVADLLDEAQRTVEACRRTPAGDNPGVVLGAFLGAAALEGRDKLVLAISPGIASFGGWIEQLVAESTGKHGKAIIPIDGEHLREPEHYGPDVVFVYLRLRSSPHAAQDRKVAVLAAAGHPVMQIDVADRRALMQEFFRFEIATAVAGSILGINPFDQPDVEAAKIEARAMMEAFQASGHLPAETPSCVADGLEIYGAPASQSATPVEALRAHLQGLHRGDYFALLAYVPMLPEHRATLSAIREYVQVSTNMPTTLGFGPRFLHSTGQAHKGGPSSGVFLHITSRPEDDVPIPARPYGFGVVLQAQAAGDLRVLQSRGRRVLRVEIGPDVRAGLATLHEAVRAALPEPPP